MPSYQPLIGITADRASHPEEQGESAYVVRRNYADAVLHAGGLPMVLPHDPGNAAVYISRIDGLLVTGGRFDLPPEWHGGAPATDTSTLKIDRSIAERALIEAALAVDLPILGICNGMQLLGVMHGAPVIEHIPEEISGALGHMAPDVPETAQHDVLFEPGSLLRDIAGVDVAQVNSIHHQALRPAPGLRVSARSPDGIVEAIELPQYRFCHGLQWHPEYHVSPADAAIVHAFIEAAGEHGGRPRSGRPPRQDEQ